MRPALLALLLAGCGASPAEHATVAVGEACVLVQEAIVESDHPDREARFECVAATCGALIDHIASEAP